MVEDKNFLSAVIARRIPQIIGMYIAAVWLTVEMADWMSNRFGVLSQLSSYVFIGMLTFLPTVMMLAWGHGRPGKDNWSKIEKMWLPLNIIISIFAISILIKSPNLEKSQVMNAVNLSELNAVNSELVKNISKTKEVSIKPNYNRVLMFFLENKTNEQSNDWLSYAAAWMVSQDLKRTPDISATTAYSSTQLMQRISNKGFKNARNIPFALALQLAKKSSKKWMTTGSYSKKDNDFVFEINLYKVDTGKLFLTHKEQDKNIFVALDKISTQLSQFIINSKTSHKNIIPDLAIQDHVSENLDAIGFIIEAYNYGMIEKDFKKAINSIKNALELDKSFALAHILAARFYQKMGDYPNAISHIDKALAMDYKIYQEHIFEIKASKFYMQGDRDKAGLVQEKWVSLFPNSPRAHGALAGYYLYSNNKLDLAKQEIEVLLKIDADNPKLLVNLGRIYRIQENKAKATEVLGRYLQENPENADAYMQMGYALSQFGLYEKAIKLYEQASILGTDDFDAEIAKAMDTMQSGDFDSAIKQLDALLLHSKTDQEKYWTLHALLEISFIRGQNEKSLKFLDQMKAPGKNVFDPFDYYFNFEDNKIAIFNNQGNYEKAIKYCQSLRENSIPPFDSIVGIFFLITYGNMGDELNYKKEFIRFEKFLKSFNNPYWQSFISAFKSRVYVWDGKKQEAIALLNQSVKIIKQSISGLSSLDKINEIEYFKANVLIDLEKFDTAIEVLDRVYQRDPTFAKAYLALARIYKQINQPEKFQFFYDKAMIIWHDADDDFVDLNKLKALLVSKNENH